MLGVLLFVPLAGAGLGWLGSWWLEVPYEEQQRRELERLARAYESIPTRIGDWEVTAEIKEDMKGEYTSVNRTYLNRKTGEEVKFLLICGYSRSLAVRTPSPSVYVNSVYADAREGSMSVQTIDGPVSLNVESRSRYYNVPNKRETVCWTYSAGDNWEAPEISRLKYGGSLAINKLLLSNEYYDPMQESASKLACEAFAKQILPVLNKSLYGPSSYDKPLLMKFNPFD